MAILSSDTGVDQIEEYENERATEGGGAPA